MPSPYLSPKNIRERVSKPFDVRFIRKPTHLTVNIKGKHP